MSEVVRVITVKIVADADADQRKAVTDRLYTMARRAGSEAAQWMNFVAAQWMAGDADVQPDDRNRIPRIQKEQRALVDQAIRLRGHRFAPGLTGTQRNMLARVVQQKYEGKNRHGVPIRAMIFSPNYRGGDRPQGNFSFRAPQPVPLKIDRGFKAMTMSDDGTFRVQITPCEVEGADDNWIAVRAWLPKGDRYARDTLRRIATGEYTTADSWKLSFRGEDLTLAICYRKPAAGTEGNGGTLNVRSTPEHLAVASVNGGEPFIRWTGDELTKAVQAWSVMRQRLNDDRKAERRTGRRRRRFEARSQQLVERWNNRIDTMIKQLSASIADRTARMKLAAIAWDDSDRTGRERFPWHKITESIRLAAEDRGLAFNVGGQPA